MATQKTSKPLYLVKPVISRFAIIITLDQIHCITAMLLILQYNL